ncbi:tripartite tricarboxylate transporter substrate binding protein [Microbaculum marinum]|uniref:Tripartite tricarboxylate transporter substrate binding protein n=1 Tax=Microbaculum marinum TaxID=1764581 RepID=A0AAW9RJB4_9HYPH
MAFTRSLKILIGLSALAATAAAGGAGAAEFPDRPVTIVVPFAAGTTTDLVARVVGEGMSENLGQPVVIENRAGAGGSVGTDEVVRADADGYTLSMGTVGTLAINKSIFPNLPYDPETDVTPIAFIGYTPTLLVVNAESDYNTLQDLVDASKSGDGVTFASAGNGTSGHLAGELVKERSGGNMVHVPFRSGAEGLTAVLSGEVDFMFYHPVAALPNIEAGTMRALGVSGAEGSSIAPDVPPIADTHEGFDLIAWFLMAAPADTPPEIAKRLNEAVEASLASDAVVAHFKKNGIEFGSIEYADLGTFISEEIAKWGDIAEAAKAGVD